ncbi:MAG: hypothetical protein JOZ15_17670 [Acidobacteria bacterium]|nr:hypothetical protein [Acidobacteriota bacterium]
MSSSWRPLLVGKAAVQALAAARDIAAVTARGVTHHPERLGPDAISVPGLWI